MKIRLYDENDKYSFKGDELDSEAQKVLKPIVEKWVKAGYSPRDIQNVVQAAVLNLILWHLCGWKD